MASGEKFAIDHINMVLAKSWFSVTVGLNFSYSTFQKFLNAIKLELVYTKAATISQEIYILSIKVSNWPTIEVPGQMRNLQFYDERHKTVMSP